MNQSNVGNYNETLEKLRYLLNKFTSFECQTDIYSQYIKKTFADNNKNITNN